MTIRIHLARGIAGISLACAAAFPALAQPVDGARVEPGTVGVGGAPKDEQVVAGGQVPDEASRAAVVGALRQVYGAGNVIDRIEVLGSLGAPPNWSNHVLKLLTASLRQIHRGQLQIDGTQLTVSGEVANEALRVKVVSDMAAALNPTYAIKSNLHVPASEQVVIDQALSNRIIEFETGSATLTRKGRELLDELAPVMATLANRAVSIVGHTDNAGSRGANLALSQARADAVKGYLVNKGMDPANFAASGAGPDRPVASNDSEQGRSRNRRIEFRVGRP